MLLSSGLYLKKEVLFMATETVSRISVRDKSVQEDLKMVVGKIITVNGVLTGGDPINKLEGEALKRDIVFQKEKQHRKFLQKEPYIKFTISDAKMELKDKDSAERIIYQQMYKNPETEEKTLTVESKNDRFTIGYRDGDKLIPIKKDSIMGKRLLFNQEVTVTYKVYQMKDSGICGIGIENIIIEGYPQFYDSSKRDSLVGCPKEQNWTSEAADFGSEGTVVKSDSNEAAEPKSEFSDVWN